jgi:DNA-directed RNA polymerase subunit M/transcription elongation factor TFIIS
MQQPKKHRRKSASQAKSARISCPACGNDEEFLEIADGVILTSHYIQNDDGSFTQDSDESEIMGDIKFFCGDCGADLTNFHQHFLDMLF